MRCSVVSSRIGLRSLATLYEQNVPPSSGSSTALKPGVRLREEQNNVQVVGEEVKGSEGPHYQGMSTLLIVHGLEAIQCQGEC